MTKGNKLHKWMSGILVLTMLWSMFPALIAAETSGTGLSVTEETSELPTETVAQSVYNPDESVAEEAAADKYVDLIMKQSPTKVVYFESEKLNLNGLVLTVVQSDGQSKDYNYRQLSDYQIKTSLAHDTVLKTSVKKVVFSHTTESGKELKATVQLTVNAKVDVTLQTPPDKAFYVAGEKLDLSGLTLSLTTTDSEVNSGAPVVDNDITPQDFVARGIGLTLKQNGALINGDPLDVQLERGTYTLTLAHSNGGKSHDYTFIVTGLPHTLEDGIYAVNVYGWHATNNAPSMMAGTLNDIAWFEVIDGKLYATIRFQETSLFGIAIDGSAMNELFPETLLSSNFVSGSGIKGIDNADGSRSFRFPLTSIDYPRAGYDIYVDGKPFMNTAGRLKFDKIVKQDKELPVVTGITIKQQPQSKYFTKNKLDLSDLSVMLTYGDGTEAEVAYEQFEELRLQTSLAHQSVLTAGVNKVVLRYLNVNGKLAVAEIPIEVQALPDFEWEELPNQTVFAVGEAFSLGGASALLTYENGDKVNISYEDFESNGITSSIPVGTELSAGDKNGVDIILTHVASGKTISLPIVVKDASQIPTALKVKVQPAKTVYFAGERLELDGIVLNVTLLDNTEINVTSEQFAQYGIVTSLQQGDTITQADTELNIKADYNRAVKPTATLSLTVKAEGYPPSNTEELEDGLYKIHVAAWHASLDQASAMASSLGQEASLEVAEGKIFATVSIVPAKIYGFPVDGNSVPELWTVAAENQVVEIGTGNKGTYNEGDKSRSFRIEIPSLDKPFLKMLVVMPTGNSIQTIRLKFDRDSLVAVQPEIEPDVDQQPDKPIVAGSDIAGMNEKTLNGLQNHQTIGLDLTSATVVMPVGILRSVLDGGNVEVKLVHGAADSQNQESIKGLMTSNQSQEKSFDLSLFAVDAEGKETAVHQLGGKIKITVKLTDSEVAKLQKAVSKHLYYYNPDAKVLEDTGAEFDLALKTVTFYSTHLSIYTLIATSSDNGSGNPNLNPNPGNGNGNPGGGGSGALDPANLADGEYTISVKALKENSSDLSMSNGLISGPVGLTVSGGSITAKLQLQGSSAFPLKEVKGLWYETSGGSYSEISLSINEAGNNMTAIFPLSSITEPQKMQVYVPFVMETKPVLQLVFETSTLKRGSLTPLPENGSGELQETSAQHVIEASAGTGGTISPSGKVTVKEGDNQTFVIAADKGYAVQDVIVNGKSVGVVAEYIFKEVKSAGSIKAVFVKVEDEETSEQPNTPVTNVNISFKDIKGHWAESYISTIAAKGWMNGTSEGVFSLDQALSRGMLVTILGRMHGVSTSYEGSAQFSDVGAGSYYSSYVAWAAEAGIVQGTGKGQFRPDRQITRQEIAVILGNYIKFVKLQLPQNTVTTTYQDEQDIADWAKGSVTLLLQAGLLNGKEGNRLDPLGTATRAETVKLIALLDEWSNK